MKEKFSLKDHLFNPKKVKYLSVLIQQAYPAFQKEEFSKEVLCEFPKLELKQRITHIAKILKKYLPADYKVAVDVLIRSLPEELDPSRSDGDFGDFIVAPFSEFVAKYGCTESYFEVSISTLKEITKRFSAEEAIRYFINQFPEKTHQVLMELTQSKNYHQRRLASEGSRLSLPWAPKIIFTKEQIISILDQLYFDSTRYVTRSVANSLNDISKADPDLTLKTLDRWESSGRQSPKEMRFIAKHALRTLLRNDHSKTLKKFGFAQVDHIRIRSFKANSKVKTGENISFHFHLETPEKSLGKIKVNYVIYYQKASGKLSPKIFKIGEYELQESQISFSKKQSFKEMTTRKHYPGKHELAIVVNGKELVRHSFEVE